ncbi:MAG: GGDEF domain-containing protein [Bdellovibrionales bacterium]
MSDISTNATPESWAARAMQHLQHDELSPTPDNFSVYYSYYSDDNPNLKMAMGALLDQYGSLTQTQCTELFLAHLSLEAENKMLQTTSKSIAEEIDHVMDVLDTSNRESTEFNQTLNTFSGTLQSNVSLDQIKSAVARVANETRIMAEQNQRLQAQLAHSTQELTEMRFNFDEARKASLVDPLTGIGNRKFFAAELMRIIEECVESGSPLSLLMCDIDHFKKFNDTYGHLVGDEVLKLVAKTLVENLKGRDIIARYGGEEFVILLPQTTVQDAEKVANQLRNILATKQVRRRRTNEMLGVVTISLGATQYLPEEDSEAFIDRADSALYDAKQTGRNKVMSR